MANYNHKLVSMPFTICCCCFVFSFLFSLFMFFTFNVPNKVNENSNIFLLFIYSLCCQLFWECIVAEVKINLEVCKYNADADIESEALPQSSQWQSDRHDHIKVIMWMVYVNVHFTRFTFWQNSVHIVCS